MDFTEIFLFHVLKWQVNLVKLCVEEKDDLQWDWLRIITFFFEQFFWMLR